MASLGVGLKLMGAGGSGEETGAGRRVRSTSHDSAL